MPSPKVCTKCANWFVDYGTGCQHCNGEIVEEPKVAWKWTDGDTLLMTKHIRELTRRIRPAEDDPADGA